MIALIALIVAVVVVGGGIEASRRMRFGSGAAAAHHRALDTLGHITTQGADHRTDVVPAREPTMLAHVRRVVEADPTHPRISPHPISRPVAIPAITGGPDFVGTVGGAEPPGRGPDTEIEGVRLLPPEPPAGVTPGDTDTDIDDAALDGPDPGDAAIEDPDPDDIDLGEADLRAVDTDEAVLDEPARNQDELDGTDVDGTDVDGTDVDGTDVDGTDVDGNEVAQSDGFDVDGGAATLTAGAAVDEVLVDDDDTQPTFIALGDEAQGEEGVADTDETMEPTVVVGLSDDGWPDDLPAPDLDETGDVAVPARPSGPTGAPLSPVDAGLPSDEGFRVLADDGREVSLAQASAASSPGDEIPGSSTLPAERTRAQLAALVRSGGVEPVGGASRSHKGGRGGTHARPSRHAGRRPGRHSRGRVAGATLGVIIVALAGASAAVIASRDSSSPGHPQAVAPPPTAPTTPATTAPPTQAASLVSQTSSTATYEVAGSPTISFTPGAACWMEVRTGDQTGTILFEGVLTSGQQKNLTGPVWVRLGDPTAMSIKINGTVLTQPALASGSPFNLQFQ